MLCDKAANALCDAADAACRKAKDACAAAKCAAEAAATVCVTIVAGEIISTKTQCPTKCEPPKEKECNPCVPPVGSGAFRTDASHDHYPFGRPHTHHFVMMQSPPTATTGKGPCTCFWHEAGVTGGASPGPGETPIGPAGGGGIAPN